MLREFERKAFEHKLLSKVKLPPIGKVNESFNLIEKDISENKDLEMLVNSIDDTE